MKVATQTAATDPRTGTIYIVMDLISMVILFICMVTNSSFAHLHTHIHTHTYTHTHTQVPSIWT
jgi:hypothetical protein